MFEYILYHYPICPLCRKVRFLLNELNINYKLQETKFQKRDDFLIELNPLLEIPILQDTVNRNVFCDSNAISEYLIEVNKNLLTQNLLSNNEIDRAEIRRIIAISDKSMYNESIKLILEEKVYNVFLHIPYNEKKFKLL